MNNFDFIKLYRSYINNFIENVKINSIVQLNDSEKRELFSEFDKISFLSENLNGKLGQKIIGMNIMRYIYTLNINGENINFIFISDLKKNQIEKLKKYYFFVVYLAINSGKTHKFLQNCYINILPLSIHKKLSKPITVDDINSGATSIYDKLGGPICIWRKDEMAKVLVHEALHSMKYDMDIIKQKLISDLKKIENKIMRNEGALNINEAYTELCATFIMCLFKAKKNMSKSDTKKVLKTQLKKMLIHSFKNCARIFKKYNIEDSKSCTLIKNIHSCNYHQEASAFSYIIIKTALLWALTTQCRYRNGHKVSDRLKCLEQFLSIGFAGHIGESYQKVIVEVLSNEKFNKEINKYISKSKGTGNFFFTIFN